MANLALGFRLEHRLIHARTIAWPPALIRTMKLIHINAVGLQQAKRRFQILPKAFRRLGMGLGRQKHLIPHAMERFAKLLLTVAIRTRGIEITHATLIGRPQQLYRFCFRHALNRQCTEPILWHGNTSRSQRYLSHTDALLTFKSCSFYYTKIPSILLNFFAKPFSVLSELSPDDIIIIVVFPVLHQAKEGLT